MDWVEVCDIDCVRVYVVYGGYCGEKLLHVKLQGHFQEKNATRNLSPVGLIYQYLISFALDPAKLIKMFL
jgi:hypothetical protein